MSLTIYTVYKHPTDYPNNYVVRSFEIKPNESIPKEVKLADTLESARGLIPSDCVLLARHPDDDSTIVESWL